MKAKNKTEYMILGSGFADPGMRAVYYCTHCMKAKSKTDYMILGSGFADPGMLAV
jgi:hypothetical protein